MKLFPFSWHHFVLQYWNIVRYAFLALEFASNAMLGGRDAPEEATGIDIHGLNLINSPAQWLRRRAAGCLKSNQEERCLI